MNELEEIAKLFAEDIKEYVLRGGSLDDLDANKVYETPTNEKE